MSKYVKFCVDYGLCGKRPSLPGVRLGHALMLSAAKQQVAKGVAYVGVFILIGAVSESLLPSAHGNTLEVIPASQRFPQ